MIFLATFESWGWWPEDADNYFVLIEADNESRARLKAANWIAIHTQDLSIHGWDEDYVAKNIDKYPLYELKHLDIVTFNAYGYYDLEGLQYET